MAVEGRTWNLNLRLSFFLGRGVRNINHPAMLRFPFRTYRSLLVPARCSRRTVGHFPLSIHTDRALRRFLCVLRRAPLPFRLRQMPGGRLPGRFLAPVGRFSVWPELSWSVSAWVGPASVAGARRSRRVRDGRKIGPDRPFPLVGSQCRVSGRPVSGPKVRMCKSSARP